jgi:hypothetical protein
MFHNENSVNSKIAQLDQRLFNAEGMISALSAEIDRMNGFKPVRPQSIKTSIPLVPIQPMFQSPPPPQAAPQSSPPIPLHNSFHLLPQVQHQQPPPQQQPQPQQIPLSQPMSQPPQSFGIAQPPFPSFGFRRGGMSRGGFMGRPTFPPRQSEEMIQTNLADILKEGEVTTFSITTGKMPSGALIQETAKAVFDGSQLTVIECQAVPDLLDLKTAKPGEILFKFMHELKDKGMISRTFNALPWRHCTVERDGQRLSLSQLRKNLQEQ